MSLFYINYNHTKIYQVTTHIPRKSATSTDFPYLNLILCSRQENNDHYKRKKNTNTN